jgi:hypothetical protein
MFDYLKKRTEFLAKNCSKVLDENKMLQAL